MIYQRPSRGRVARALTLTRESRTESIVTTDISIDAAYMLLVAVQKKRSKAQTRVTGKDLKRLVVHASLYFDFDPARRRIYELIAMRYYTLTWQAIARFRRRQRQRAKVQIQQRAVKAA
jgi:hypothetical protein